MGSFFNEAPSYRIGARVCSPALLHKMRDQCLKTGCPDWNPASLERRRRGRGGSAMAFSPATALTRPSANSMSRRMASRDRLRRTDRPPLGVADQRKTPLQDAMIRQRREEPGRPIDRGCLAVPVLRECRREPPVHRFERRTIAPEPGRMRGSVGASADTEAFADAGETLARPHQQARGRMRDALAPVFDLTAQPSDLLAGSLRAQPRLPAAGNPTRCVCAFARKQRRSCCEATSSRCRRSPSRRSPLGSARIKPAQVGAAALLVRATQHESVRRARLSTCAISSLRTGTAISAAAVGVGARLVGRKVDQRHVGLVPDRRDQRDVAAAAAARTTTSSLNDHRSSSEPPPRATMITSGRGDAPAGRERIEAADRGRDLGGRASPCTRTGQTSDPARKAIGAAGAGCRG